MRPDGSDESEANKARQLSAARSATPGQYSLSPLFVFEEGMKLIIVPAAILLFSLLAPIGNLQAAEQEIQPTLKVNEKVILDKLIERTLERALEPLPSK